MDFLRRTQSRQRSVFLNLMVFAPEIFDLRNGQPELLRRTYPATLSVLPLRNFSRDVGPTQIFNLGGPPTRDPVKLKNRKTKV
jgi:hypothetical protein